MADLTRLGISLTKDGAKKLAELANDASTSQSNFIESFIWWVAEEPLALKRVTDFITERKRVEEDLIALARSKPAEAKKLLAKLEK